MYFLQWIQNFDIAAVRLVREYVACSILDFIMPIVTLLGEDGIFWILLTLCLLFFKRTRKAGFVMGLSLLIGFVIGNLTLKPLIDRPRPYEVDGVKILIDKLSDGSFPSGHTLCCFEGAVSLVLCGYKKWGTVAAVSAVLVAFSRVYLYVHYPSDVIAGAVLGCIFAYISYVFVNKLYLCFSKSKTL